MPHQCIICQHIFDTEYDLHRHIGFGCHNTRLTGADIDSIIDRHDEEHNISLIEKQRIREGLHNFTKVQPPENYVSAYGGLYLTAYEQAYDAIDLYLRDGIQNHINIPATPPAHPDVTVAVASKKRRCCAKKCQRRKPKKSRRRKHKKRKHKKTQKRTRK